MSDDHSNDHACPHNPGDGTRRRFCQTCIGVMSAASAAMVGYPVAAFLQRPEKLDSNKPVEVSLAQLTVGQAQYVDFHGQQIIVLLSAEGPRVFSSSCPHLGCSVSWDPADNIFKCPCHGAMFNAKGEVIRGPAAAPLESLPFEVKDGKLIVA